MHNFLRFLFWTALITCVVIAVSKRVFSERDDIGLSLVGGPAETNRWEMVDTGINYRYVKFAHDPDDVIGLKMIQIDQSVLEPRILYARNLGEQVLTVREMVEKSGALAGINANYFDEQDRPLGYLKVAGREINDYIATPLIYSGVFAIRNGKGCILHRDDFHPAEYEDALQVGPRLIAREDYTQGVQKMIDYREKARRAGIAVDKKGRIVLFVTSPPSAEMNWKELRSILSGPDHAGGISPRDVLNLDGGGSTQLCVRAQKLNFTEGYAKVPVAIGFFKR